MRIYWYLFACLWVQLCGVQRVFSQDLLPVPTHVRYDSGRFVLSSSTCISGDLPASDLEREAVRLRAAVGLPLSVVAGGDGANGISLHRADNMADEAYSLRVDGDGIRIVAGSSAGFFYAYQTLAQLSDGTSIPFVAIADAPRFPYRGMMIDCSRHFWDVAFLKRQIAAMSRFKLNRLHLHLTDAGGWRMEVKSYPLLTERVSSRTESDWIRWWIGGDRRYCDAGIGYGGFYTQDELRELVRYAAEHEVTIIPEIEMPGHSEEVLFAYPELRCDGADDSTGDFCIGNEATFTFLEKVLSEVMAVFPSTYIHIGGDESSGNAWAACSRCRERMRAEGMDSPKQLQTYLTARIGRFLRSHGRVLMGWDELVTLPDGDRPVSEGDDAYVIMSWRGESGGIAAARAGHRVVMTPGGYCYLDGYQDAPESEPRAFGGYLPLERVYSYHPVPADLRATGADSLVLGVQGNLWTEMIATPEHAEYMLYPRILAIAERGWSSEHVLEGVDYSDFRRRALTAQSWLCSNGYHPFDLSAEKGRRVLSLAPVVHEGMGKRVVYHTPYADAYRAAGEQSLTDGRCGNWSFGDGCWQGFIGNNGMDVVVDMGKKQPIRNVAADFMQFSGPEIFEPGEIVLSVSNDGKRFKELRRERVTVSRDRDYFIRHFVWNGNVRSRYIRLHATPGTLDGWIFTDEIIINSERQ